MIIVRRLYQTLDACPSQWEGFTDSGKLVYIRYRWGELSVYISLMPYLKSMVDAIIIGDPFHLEQLGDDLDGELPFEELKEVLGSIIQLPESCNTSKISVGKIIARVARMYDNKLAKNPSTPDESL